MTKKQQLTPNLLALAGLFSLVPFLVLNAAVANQTKWLITFLRPTGHTNVLELVVGVVVLLLLPLVGAFVALSPMLGVRGKKRKVYAFNMAVALTLVFIAVGLSAALGTEIYHCEVLQVVNCD